MRPLVSLMGYCPLSKYRAENNRFIDCGMSDSTRWR